MNKCRLSPASLGLSLGFLSGLSMFILGLLATYYSYGKPFVAAVGALYVGYEPTLFGSFIGGVLAFINSFIFGFLIAWLYNLFAGCYDKKNTLE